MHVHRPRRIAAAVVAVALALLGTSACSPAGLTRQQVKDGYRSQLVGKGVSEPLARCITDSFFDHLTDAQLRAFQSRDRLTADEQVQFGALATTCGSTIGA
jgi:hypothetical protein